MELLFDDEYYDTESFAEGKYLTDLKEDLLEFDKNLTATRGDTGHGADFPIFPIVIIERFNENLEAWLEISKKNKKVV